MIVYAAAAVSGCATTGRRPITSAKGELYLKEACERNDILWDWDQVSEVVTLRYKGAKARAMIDSDLILIGGEKVTLSAPMRRDRGAVIIPEDFQWKVIDRLREDIISRKVYGIPKVRKIIIDAGHGGKDPGAISRNGTKEKGIVLDIAQRLKRILQDKGVKVVMTRDSDEFISLEGRTAIAVRENTDLFVSIHANSSPARSVYGIEVYSQKNLKKVDRIALERKVNERTLFRNLAMRQNAPEVQKIVSDMLYVNKQIESRSLARDVAQKSSQRTKTKNLGPKTADFHVLRNTLVPAILVEVGFLSNPKEEKLLKTEDYRQKIAESLAEGILDYVNER
jgi:N-acetylmuramoyl-L-alanine amidase